MKVAKKFLALALSVALSAGCMTAGVSAAGSRTNDITVSAEQAQIYEISKDLDKSESYAALKEDAPEVAAAFQDVNEGKMDGFVEVLTALAADIEDEDVKKAVEDVIAKLDGKDFVTAFTEFKLLDSEAEKNADGKYEAELSFPGLTDEMENIQILCYSKANPAVWEIIDVISIDKENKTLKAALPGDCFFTIITDAVDTAE